MKKGTAVEWLVQKINHTGWGDIMIDIPKEFIEQAKAMEKAQLIEAYEQGEDEWTSMIDYKNAQEYYKQTYEQ